MFDEKELPKAFGTSDEKFRNNFDNVLNKLRAEGSPRRTGRPILKAAAIICAVIAMMTLTVYAMERIFVDRADVGASWELVSAPEDYYESVNTTMLRLIYNADVTEDRQPRIGAETASVLREMLDGMVFNADAEPVDIMSPITDSDEFCADLGHGALYNDEGEELWEIRYETVGYGGPQEIVLTTRTERESQLEAERNGTHGIKLTDSYEEAKSLLGVDFVLPGVYTESFDAPEFRYQNERPVTEREAVYVTYGGNPGIYYFAEAERGEDEVPFEWHAIGAVIERREISGVTVYKAVSEEFIRYTWTCDGVAYMIFQDYYPDEFTDEQFVEIIESMIR